MAGVFHYCLQEINIARTGTVMRRHAFGCLGNMLPATIPIIVNTAAGTEEPIEAIVQEVAESSNQLFQLHIAHQPEQVFELADQLRKNGEPIIAVYGGDGTVMEVAKALHNSHTALFIIPGGTANVMAKELALPLKSREALELLVSGTYEIKAVDMGLVNDCPFLIRVNLGILADMVSETSEEMKDKWGQWAYGITALQQLPDEGIVYEITIDGQQQQEKAVALTITNAGNIGRKGYSFLPGISISDGWLDLIILEDTGFLSLLSVTGNILLQKDTDKLKHFRVKEVILRGTGPLHFLCDDKPESAPEIRVQVSPASLKMAFPVKQAGNEKN